MIEVSGLTKRYGPDNTRNKPPAIMKNRNYTEESIC